MRTQTRLTVWLGTLFVLVVVLAVVGLGTIWKLRTAGKDVLTANYNSIEYAQRMLSALDELEDPQVLAGALKEQLEKQSGNITEVGEAEVTGRLIDRVDELRQHPLDQSLRRQIRKELNSIIELNRAAIVRKSGEAEDRAGTAVMWISIVGTLSFLIAFTLLLTLPQRIAEPIRKLTEGIDRIAEGHYRERVQIEGGGEFGLMAQRFNAMAGELERWENSNLARVMEEKARAEAVINSLQDASIGLDDQGRILFVNRRALELLGLDEADTIAKPATEVAQRNDLLKHILNDKAAVPFKAVLGGTENYFVSASSMIQGPSGALGTVFTVRNITPFQERDQAKTYFLATISHELKTPLASTDIGLKLLERSADRLTPEQRAIAVDLRKDHQRLVHIVSELLDLAQAETGNIRLQVTEVPLDRMIRSGIDAVKMSAQEKNVRFDLPTDTAVPKVKADADKAIWVLVNVLTNAVRFSPPGGTVHVRIGPVEDGIVLTVQDEGPGVAPSLRDRLFEPFRTTGGADGRGTGLGLAISHEFMQAMGGGISSVEHAGVGAMFALRFARA